MDVHIAGSAGQQIAPHKVNRPYRKRQFRHGDSLANLGQAPAGATSARSSYRQMRLKGPVFESHALADERPVQPLPKAGQRLAPHSYPVYPCGATAWEGTRPGQPDLERIRLHELIRGGAEPGHAFRGNVTHEAQCDVQALRGNPAHGRQGFAKGGQRPPQPLAHRVGRPHGEKEAQGRQATGTATGRSAASTP